jgi:hypothetical protein
VCERTLSMSDQAFTPLKIGYCLWLSGKEEGGGIPQASYQGHNIIIKCGLIKHSSCAYSEGERLNRLVRQYLAA